MLRHYTSFYCRRCQQLRRFTKRGLNHSRHLTLTLLSFGLWGIPWLFMRRKEKRRRWHCCICGAGQEPMEEPPTAKSMREKRKCESSPVEIRPRRNLRF
jgi:hypothetical protein